MRFLPKKTARICNSTTAPFYSDTCIYMNLQQAKILLDKINALYKNMGNDPTNVSSIEKDLMKSYVTKLYEAFLDLPTAAVAPAPPPAQVVEEPKIAPRITLRKPDPVAPVAPPPAPAPPPPVQTVKPEPPVRVERPHVPAPAQNPPPAPAQEPAPVVVVRQDPPKAEAPPPPPPAPAAVRNDELEELFSFASAKELSEKLSELPITDIKKAMGLNERIFTINELFGGDHAAFDATVSTLNQLRSYDEAKDYLIRNVAGRYNWASKEKRNKAKEFAKLVRRRFN